MRTRAWPRADRGGLVLVSVLLVLASLTSIARAEGPARRERPITMAVGSYGDLAVVLSAPDLRGDVRPALDRLNTQVTFVIREEPTFAVDFYAADEWKFAHDYKNLLILVNWSDGGRVVRAVEELLEAPDLARLRAAGGGLAQLIDPLLSYQFAVIVAARDRTQLAALLDRNADRLRELYEKQNRERIRRQFTREGLHDDWLARYWRSYRILLCIPAAYRENQVEPAGFPGIEWTRAGPTRGITLSWRRAPHPETLLADRPALLAMRRDMGRVLHREEISDEGLAWESTRLGELPALRLTGSWISREIQAGGAFWSYFIADPTGERVFCLDLLAYMPHVDEPKMPLYRELLAIAETFSLQQPHP